MEVELEVETCVVGLGGVTVPRIGNFNNALRNISPTCVKCMALPTCFFMLWAEREAGADADRHLENVQCVPALANPLMDKTSAAATSVVA